MSLEELDKGYLSAIRSTYTKLVDAADRMRGHRFDLASREISNATLVRLKTFYETQQNTKVLLAKRYQTPAADFFVETVTFFLKLYLESIDETAEVHSERQIRRTRNSIRPDISIWRGDDVLAIVECKTQLGWSRKNWEQQFLSREEHLRIHHPAAKAFLLVMTGSNWGGFANSQKLGKQYFCLLDDIWPIDYNLDSKVLTPIEGLFRQIAGSI